MIYASPCLYDPIWYLSVQVCGRKPAGSEDLSNQFEESPKKSDQDDDYKWTIASRRLGVALSTRGGQTFPKSMEIRNSVAFHAVFSVFFPSVFFRGGRIGFRAASPTYRRTGRPIMAE